VLTYYFEEELAYANSKHPKENFMTLKDAGEGIAYIIKSVETEDEELDSMILEARESTDQEYRKAMYKACLDTIIDWACEIPVYQRQNAIIFSTERVNIDTVTPDITTFYGWMQEIQNIEMR
jgi:ABC-type transport system substrate-binding protein